MSARTPFKGSWQAQHYVHRNLPQTPADRKVVGLLDALDTSINNYLTSGGRFPDSNASEAYGQMLDGVVQLLNERLDFLDAGTLWDEVAMLAEKIWWDLDASEIDWRDQ